MESKSEYNKLISKLNDKGEIVVNMTRTMKNTIQTLQRKGYVYRYGDLVKLTHLIPVGSIKLLKPTYTNYSDYLDKRISSLEVPLNEYESKGITILQHFHLLQRDGYNNMTIQEVIDEIDRPRESVFMAIQTLKDGGFIERITGMVKFIEYIPAGIRFGDKAKVAKKKPIHVKAFDEIKAVKSMAKEFDFNITKVLYDSLNFVNNLC